MRRESIAEMEGEMHEDCRRIKGARKISRGEKWIMENYLTLESAQVALIPTFQMAHKEFLLCIATLNESSHLWVSPNYGRKTYQS